MKKITQITTLGVLTALAAGAVTPLAAHADDRSTQNNKNLMRNLALGAGALGLYGFASHNNTLGLLGVAGAAVAGSQYERDRHNQSVDNSRDYNRYYHRNNGDNYDGRNYDGRNYDGRNYDGRNYDGRNYDGRNYDSYRGNSGDWGGYGWRGDR